MHDGEQNLPIASMPGVDRLGWRHGLIDAVAEARSYGVNQVVIFPKVRPKPCENPRYPKYYFANLVGIFLRDG